MKRIITTALAVLAVITAPTAHADDGAYVADLQAAGVPMPQGPGRAIAAAYMVCGELRNGMPSQYAATTFGWANMWGPQIVSAAQRDVCPDTLR